MVDRKTRVFVNQTIAKHRKEIDNMHKEFSKQLFDIQERLDHALTEIETLKKG